MKAYVGDSKVRIELKTPLKERITHVFISPKAMISIL